MMSPEKNPFDHFSAHYEEYLRDPIKVWMGGDSSEYYLRLKANEILRRLHRLGLDSKRLKGLDVGCATGQVIQMLHKEFLELQGVDSSEGMIERARRVSLPNVCFHQSDAGHLPFESNLFDVIYSMCLLHHVPEDHHLDILKEMVRVLKPGGWLFTFEHNALNPLTRWVVKRCPVDQGVKLLRAHQTASLCRQLNLAQIHKRFILFFPKWIPPLKSLEPYLFWLPVGGQFYVCGRKRDSGPRPIAPRPKD